MSDSSGECRRRPRPIGAGSSTWPHRSRTGAGWPSCSIPGPSAGAAATRDRTRNATSARRSSRPTWSRLSCSCPRTCSTTTTAPGIILVLNTRKRHKGEILLINASKLCSKGRPKNYLGETHVKRISQLYRDWKTAVGLSVIVTKEDAAKNDYILSPSRYVATSGAEEVLPLEEAVVLLQEAEEERTEADRRLKEVLAALGFGD